MSNIEKALSKAVDALKIQLHSNQPDEAVSRRKEKIASCVAIADALCQSNSRNSTNFDSTKSRNLLSNSFEALFQLCDDDDSHVRLVADESLNRVIRSLLDNHCIKVMVELHKEIKKNGKPYSLRAALWRFAELSSNISAQKGRKYIQNTVPCLVEVAKRKEEAVLETLASSLPKILSSLGIFTTDNEIKMLLRVFFTNLTSNEAVVRRTAASSIMDVCIHSRKPAVFLAYVFNALLDCVIPVVSNQNIPLLLGVLLCIRYILPHLLSMKPVQEPDLQLKPRSTANVSFDSTTVSVDRFIQVFELCLHFCNHSDNNVITSSLETLYQLLLSKPKELVEIITSSNSLTRSRIHTNSSQYKFSLQRSISLVSVATSAIPDDKSLLDVDVKPGITATHLEQVVDEENSVEEQSLDTGARLRQWLDAAQTCSSLEQPSTLSEQDPTVQLQADYSNIHIGALKDDSFSEKDGSSLKSEETSKENFLCKAENNDDNPMEPDLRTYSPSKSCDLSMTHSDVPQVWEIGSLMDGNSPLIYCARRLITGFLLTEQSGVVKVKVSTRALAISCLTEVLQLDPKIGLLSIDITNIQSFEGFNTILDVALSYASHSDPQLRGLLCVLIGTFIKSVLRVGKNNYNEWLKNNNGCSSYSLEEVVKVLIQGLVDESSVCARLSLIGVSICLNTVIMTNHKASLEILYALLKVATNPYWLVKVKLLETISTLPFMNIKYLTGNQEYQNSIIHNVILVCLSDNDNRVRKSAAECLCCIIKYLYYPADHNFEHEVIASSKEIEDDYCKVFNFDSSALTEHMIDTLNVTEKIGKQAEYNPLVDAALSRILQILSKKLINFSSKYIVLGCCETLCLLSMKYPTFVYKKAWQCCHIPSEASSKSSLSIGLFSSVISLLNSSAACMDLDAQNWLCILAGNLFMGLADAFTKSNFHMSPKLTETRYLWSFFRDKRFENFSENLLLYVVRMLNIFMNILNEPLPNQNITTPSLRALAPPTISPMKRKNRSGSPTKSLSEIDKKSDEKTKSYGHYAHSSRFLKIQDMLKSVFSNYKVTLAAGPSEKFINLLETILNVLSKMLSFMTIKESGRIAEEILYCLKFTFPIKPVDSIKCVLSLLQSIFCTNQFSQLTNEHHKSGKVATRSEKKENPADSDLLYNHCFHVPFQKFSDYVETHTKDVTPASDLINRHVKSRSGSETFKDWKSTSHFVKTTEKNLDTAVLTSYINLSESMIVMALNQCIVTSNVELQATIIAFMTELVLLGVNYWLFDSNQIFIKFVLTQFEYLEGGQIYNPELLIPKIFNFLVHLSNDKNHSKPVMCIPKVIQLCDGLIASGQPLELFCIPALYPIVEHVFLLRTNQILNAEDLKELKTQREVLFAMLLRLVNHPEVLHLLCLIINHDQDDTWNQRSQQIFDALIRVLPLRQVKIDSVHTLGIFLNLLNSLSPSVFVTPNSILKVLFDSLLQNEESKSSERWVVVVLSMLLLLITTSKENMILSSIENLELCCLPLDSLDESSPASDPLNVTAATQFQAPPDKVFARFLLRVIALVSARLHTLLFSSTCDSELLFLNQLTSCLLLTYISVFQSGLFRKTAEGMMKIIQDPKEGKPVEHLSFLFKDISVHYPVLGLQWFYLLSVLNFTSDPFWKDVLSVSSEWSCKPALLSSRININFNSQILNLGSLLLYCDYLSDRIEESADGLKWLFDNYLHTIIMAFNEPPIKELLININRNPSTGSLFLKSLQTLAPKHSSQPVFISRLFNCLELSHPDLSGEVILFTVPNFLQSQNLSSSRLVASLNCRKIEYLLTQPNENALKQISEESLILCRKKLFTSPKLLRRHPNLLCLINKLAHACYQLPPLEGEQNKPLNIASLRDISVNKPWLLTQVKLRCCRVDCSPVQSARLLGHLEFDDIVEILRCQQFNNSILQHCFDVSKQNKEKNEVSRSHSSSLALTPLYFAAKQALMSHLQHLKSILPRVQQVYKPLGRILSMKEEKYSEQMDDLFNNVEFNELLYQLIPAVSKYLESLELNPDESLKDSIKDFIRFGVLCMEVLFWTLSEVESNSPAPSVLEMILSCNCLIFQLEAVQNVIIETHVCTLSSALIRTVQFVTNESLELVCNVGLEKMMDDPDSAPIAHSCYQMSSLINWLRDFSDFRNVPQFLFTPLKDLIITISRLEIINSYLRISPDAWKQPGWYEDLKSVNQIPALPLFCLHDADILNQLVYRISLLGWRNRQQFEETWMLLLTILNTTFEPAAPPVEITAVLQTICTGINAITTLLIGTLKLPHPGNNSNCEVIHASRYNLNFLSSNDWGKKLIEINDLLSDKIENVHSSFKLTIKLRQFSKLVNAERTYSHKRYGYNQVSVNYLRTLVQSEDWKDAAINRENWENNNWNEVCIAHKSRLEKYGLDLSSCLQFLIDLYAQWVSQKHCHLPLLYEVIKSSVILSDLFMDYGHFQWMLGACLLLYKTHLIEDDIMNQYLIIAICKSAAVLQNLEPGILCKVMKVLELGLRSSFLPSKLSALHSLLYLLESYVTPDFNLEELSADKVGEVVKYESKSIFPDIKNILDDDKEFNDIDADLKSTNVEIMLPSKYYVENSQAVLHIALEFVERNLSLQLMGLHNEEFQLCTISISLYIVENAKLEEINPDLCQTILNTLLELCKISANLKHYSIYQALMQGFERIILTQKHKYAHSQITRLAIDRFSQTDPIISLIALQLFISCFYSQTSTSTEASNDFVSSSDPELLVSKMENIPTFFQRIKVSSPLEVEIICTVLPRILTDFFPASDLLSKVIGEFLSPQQPYPHFMADIVFKVFEKAYEQEQLPLLQDWIVTSLTSLIQGLSVAMATWCLTCFFISASVNPCLRALFPHVQSRIGRLEYEDRKLLCISASHFYHSLASDELKRTFLKTFQSTDVETSQIQLINPFSCIVQCLLQ